MNTLEPVLNDPPATTPQSELRRGAVAALPVLLGFILVPWYSARRLPSTSWQQAKWL